MAAMPLRIKPVAVVLLVGADAAAVASLQPSAEVLSGFGIAVKTAVVADGGARAATLDGMCAVIVASPDEGLPASVASMTKIPVIRVPTETTEQHGLDLLKDETGNLPSGAHEGVFATMAIGVAGAKNAALFVVSVLALANEQLRAEYAGYRVRQSADVLNHPPLGL